MKTVQITEGVFLHHIPDNKFKSATVSMFFHRPLCIEEASMNALLPAVLKRGTSEHKDFGEIERRLMDLCGASVSGAVLKRGDSQLLFFEASSLANRYAPDGEDLVGGTVDLLLEIILKPYTEQGVFSESYVASEKKNLMEAIEAMVNDKMQYALWRCTEEMFKGEPYGVHELGTLETVETITPQALYAHYKKVLSESRIDVFVCGSADLESVQSKLAPHFCARKVEAFETKPKLAGSEVKKVTETFDASQAKLTLGLTTGFDAKKHSYVHMMMANSILGSGVHSKLFNNVREKLSLAYYAFSRIDRLKQTMIIGMGIEKENYDAAYNETMAQLAALQKGEISDYEFESAKAFLVNNTISSTDSQTAMTAYYLSAMLNGETMTIEERVAQIEATTREDVVAAAKDIRLEMIYFLGANS
ncbi:MAG: insulinase family protein [Clostridia bacterium]|nr:insulinase family protein [Clostridia bacterium]